MKPLSSSAPPVALLTSFKTSSSSSSITAQCAIHSTEHDCILFLATCKTNPSIPDIKSLSILRSCDVLSRTTKNVWDGSIAMQIFSQSFRSNDNDNNNDEEEEDATSAVLKTVSQIGLSGLQERLTDALSATNTSPKNKNSNAGWTEEFLKSSEAIVAEFLSAVKQHRTRVESKQKMEQLEKQQRKRKRNESSIRHTPSSVSAPVHKDSNDFTPSPKFYAALLSQLQILESYKNNHQTNNDNIKISKIDVNDTLTKITIQCTDPSHRTHTLHARLNPTSFPYTKPEFIVDLPCNDNDENAFNPPWKLNDETPGLVGVILNHYIPILTKYQTLWNDVLQDLDVNTWILEPELPSSFQNCTTRRIVVEVGLSVVVMIDVEDCRGIPLQMRLIGNGENNVEELRGRYADFISDEEEEEEEDEGNEEEILTQQESDTKQKKKKKWSKQVSIRENLEAWLGFPLPSPNSTENNNNDKSDYIVECGICYAHRLPLEPSSDNDEGRKSGPIPDVICGNATCQRCYHESCLFEWLHALPSARISFDRIFGTCPYCMESLSVGMSAAASSAGNGGG